MCSVCMYVYSVCRTYSGSICLIKNPAFFPSHTTEHFNKTQSPNKTHSSEYSTYLIPLEIDAQMEVQEVPHIISGDLGDRQVAMAHFIQ